MKSLLQDIIKHTHGLGIFDKVRISCDDKKLSLLSYDEKRTVLLKAETVAVPDLKGVFGMPQLSKLDYLMKCPEYKEKATISLYKDKEDNESPNGIQFANKVGDFINKYRFMPTNVINAMMPEPVSKGVPAWDIELVPSRANIQRFEFQRGAHSDEPAFYPRTVNDSIEFVFGEANNHNGKFVFASGIKGKLNNDKGFSIDSTLKVLGLEATSESCIMRFSDKGMIQVEINSGIMVYTYHLLALAK